MKPRPQLWGSASGLARSELLDTTYVSWGDIPAIRLLQQWGSRGEWVGCYQSWARVCVVEWGYQRGLGSQDCVLEFRMSSVCVWKIGWGAGLRQGRWADRSVHPSVYGEAQPLRHWQWWVGVVFFFIWGRHRGEKAMGKRVATLTTEHAQ